MIFFDNIGHMITDCEPDELHAFAQEIGLKREWYQEKGWYSHYALTTQRMRDKARRYGAKEIHPKELVRKLIKKKEQPV